MRVNKHARRRLCQGRQQKRPPGKHTSVCELANGFGARTHHQPAQDGFGGADIIIWQPASIWLTIFS